MIKTKPFIIIISLIFAFGLQVNAAEKTDLAVLLQNNTELNTLLETVNEEHRSVLKPVIDYEQYIQNFSADKSEYGKYQKAVNDFSPKTVVDKDAVAADIDVLFKILETTYGGYYYFGGDEAFSAARSAISDECSLPENITGEQFAKSISEHLKIIKDSHFTINNSSLYDFFLPGLYNGAEFIKDGEDFKNLLTGKKIAGIEGYEDWKDLLKRFISEDGGLVYRPVVISDKNLENTTLKVIYEDKTEQMLTKSNKAMQSGQLPGYGDLPIVRSRTSMGFDHSKNDRGAKLFLENARKNKDEPILIVDIRNNGGGNGVLPIKWFMEYTGELVPSNYSALKYMNNEELKLNCENTNSPYHIPYEELTDVAGFTPISESYMKANDHPDTFVSNEQLLIILVDKNTASASECFVDMAYNLENTLIVGTNTNGCLVGDAFTSIYLPNSGIKVQFGAGIGFFPENYFKEYIGFEPDLWVDGNAEEMVFKFLRRIMSE